MNETSASESQLLVLRIWVEEMGSGRFEIRGQAKHIETGEICYFREWSALQSFLTKRLGEPKSCQLSDSKSSQSE